MKAVRTLALSLFAAWSLGGVAQAAPVLSIPDLVGTTSGNDDTIGWEFTTNTAVTVTRLGFFDSGQDGLLTPHDVGIFDNSGTLLRSAIVPSGIAGPLINQFRYVAIAPLALAAGSTFRIGAYLPASSGGLGADDLFVQVTVPTTDPAITYQTGRFAGNTGGLAFPTTSLGSARFIGPNFEILAAEPQASRN